MWCLHLSAPTPPCARCDRITFGGDMRVLLCTFHVKRAWLNFLLKHVRILCWLSLCCAEAAVDHDASYAWPSVFDPVVFVCRRSSAALCDKLCSKG